MIQSAKGQEIWEKISSALHTKIMTAEDASRENPALLQSCSRNERRDQVLKTACSGNFDILEELFPKPKKLTLSMRIKNKLKRMLPM